MDKYLKLHPDADRDNHWVNNDPSSNQQAHKMEGTPVPPAKAVKDAYNTVQEATKGFFRDEDWSGIYNIPKKLLEQGWQTERTNIDNSNYKPEGGSKSWMFDLLHPSGQKLRARITAYSAGQKTPWDAYDLTAQFYK